MATAKANITRKKILKRIELELAQARGFKA
jgi:hypothetical protein